MEYIILIGTIVFLTIYLLAKESRKESRKERYGEAISELTQMAANKISGTVYSITEPADKKKLRLAKEKLAVRNGNLYRSNDRSEEYMEKLLTVDDSYRSALEDLGLSEERWHKIALMIFYIGTIRILSRNSSDYSQKKTKHYREHMINSWSTDSLMKTKLESLIKALNYFNIRIDEWLEYGDAVVEMYDLCDKPDMKEFGIISSIMPKNNNKHLL